MLKKTALAATLFIAGCTGNPDVKPSLPPLAAECSPLSEPEPELGWRLFPESEFASSEIKQAAHALGVTVLDIKTSLYGGVECDPPLPYERVYGSQPPIVVSVKNIGDRCVIMAGVTVGNPAPAPTPGQNYDRFMAVCPLTSHGTPLPTPR